MKGLIMAGGEGTRLRPLTCGKPKPMIDVMGKPVMEYIIELMKNAGISDIAVTLMYMPHIITEYFGDGKRFGVNLTYFVEQTPLGTAGSVKNAEAFLDEPFIIVSGDCLTDIDLNAAMDFHKNKNAEATLVLTSVRNPLEYGIVVTDDSGRIVRFLEKPSWSEVFSDTANTGIYVLNPSVLDRIPPHEQYDFSKDLYPKMLSDDAALYGYVAKGYWCDIGDIAAYRRCHFDILDQKVNVNTNAVSKDRIMTGENTVIEPNTLITPPCYIGSGAVIRSGAKILPYSVIGENCRISEGASVKKSVMQRNIYIGKSAQVRGSILADGAYLGAHSTVLENSVVGEKTHIGEMCEIRNNIKIWPEKNIENETTVSANLIWGDNFSRRLFGDNGVTGEINVDVTPEFATRMGASFGASNKNSKLSISGGGGALDMIRSALISGMLSSGVRVFDLGTVTLPVSRRAIPFYGLDGGIHISLYEGGNETRLSITFLDKKGIDISRDAERKIEGLFMREDFMRCEPSEIQKVTTLYDYNLYYMREILNEINAKLKMNICIEGNNKAAELISELGATVSPTGGKGTITAIIDDHAERLVLVDELGRTISGEKYSALASYIAIKSGSKTVAAPLSGSAAIDAIANKLGASVVRCKTGKACMMSCMQEHNPVQFRLMYDAVYALAKICSVLSAEGVMLSDLTSEIPEIHIVEKEVLCETGKKGSVIRSIATKYGKNGEKIELEEGVKIINDKGWVLVIPHGEKPICRVISEGKNEEFANELCDIYIKEVEKLSE
ncbi:MAG: D-glycero-alpha-D-manno-heptose 1-phosphate guanylyltransferase [Firmicutes bacterium ADurb.Bin193]|nr:MAG: D-glycero-alpha-D-manno-heptose 1-phosphate guanylyltransferase [Firmicutes bacterium ADurb.Bin193]